MSNLVIEGDLPQTQGHPGQVPNSAGGYSFEVTDLTRLRRFLILGCEGGNYYTSEKKLGIENAQCIVRLLEGGQGLAVVSEIEACSHDNRAAKQDPLIFALAICARCVYHDVQKAAYVALPNVCRIPTHLFAVIAYCELLSTGTGWSRSHKRGISEWYANKSASQLSMLVTKYKQREGWSHQDVLRLAHITPPSKAHDIVFRYAAKGHDTLGSIAEYSAAHGSDADDCAVEVKKVVSLLDAVEHAKTVTDALEMAHLIRTHSLVREHVPTALLNSTDVWAALLEHMPMTAMLRNLGKMTSIGLLTPGSEHSEIVVSRLASESELHAAKIHPFAVRLALKTYGRGCGEKGSLQWDPVPSICNALDDAYYMAFANVKPTGQRLVLALDVSGSMGGATVQGSSITAREGAAAMAMLAARTEQNSVFMAFQDAFVPLDIAAHHRLEDVIEATSSLPFGNTDCSLPMLWAHENDVLADCFIVLTDSETFAGYVAPHVALQRYREATGIQAKLVVMAMTSNGFSIADPSDAGMLDMVGFDSSAPEVLREFLLGRL